MNQYIITEELRDLIMYRLGNGGYTDLKWRIKRETESRPYQSERAKVLDEVNAVLLVRKMYMEELFEELRNPAVAKHSLQQIEIIRSRVNDLRDMKAGEP